MRLLLLTNYIGSFDDACEVTHVVVDVDPRHQLDMWSRLSDVLGLPGIYSVTFFDYTPQPALCEFYDDVPDWFDEEAELISVPDGVSPPAADLRIDAPTIRYMPDGIMWRFYEKHGGAGYETATIPWEFLRAAAKDKGGNRAQIPR